ncbi:MAG: hypothetical protein FKY71_20135 [Spiribacter salinus]|uniref:Uncharacterized protein n=1 Tax=Spiribacter salinus TaxID=1335746 RepID=A0A540V4Q5_9GAMM|nr:MAG: hypothetical protein FKY71_20135 [Spiribacter salinus]
MTGEIDTSNEAVGRLVFDSLTASPTDLSSMSETLCALAVERDALRSIIRALLDCPHIADRDTYPWHEPETEAAVRRAYEALPDEGDEE